MKNQATRARLRVGLTLAVLISAVALVLSTATLASAQSVYPSWSYTGNLNNVRISHTTTLLSNGKVLVAGGFGFDCPPSCGYLSSAELYDSATGTWSFTGNFNTTRAYHTATLLSNGKVLVAGGVKNENTPVLKSAELYDPATGMWSSTGNLNFAHYGHTATLLPNGKVLVAGGYFNGNSAELYDPVTGTWSITGNLNVFRGGHTATLLSDGRVLVVAGADCSGSGEDCPLVDSSELYDPATGTWSNTGHLNTGRIYHTTTLLLNGKVLVAGGYDNNVVLRSAELYDPATGMWSNTGNLDTERYLHTGTLLPNGKVLVASGAGALNSAELYDPATGAWSITAYLNTARGAHTATLLPNGKVLVACGSAVGPLSRTTELYDPSASPNTNIIDDARFIVQQHYIDFLNREPDASGLAFWTNQITSCGADALCIELKRINVSAAFFFSIEFQNTGYFVYRIEKAAFGNRPNAPVPVQRNEFLLDTRQIAQGVVVNQPGWEQLLENNKQFFIADFVENRLPFPSSTTPAEFVDELFLNAGVTPSDADRRAIINEFGSADTIEDLAACARVLRRVAENSAFAQQEFNRAFVLMQYFGYLRRNPNDPPEPTLDFQGYNFWLTKLNQFNGNFTNAEMVKAFLISSEYRQRFGQP